MQIVVDSCDAPDFGLFQIVGTPHSNKDVKNGKKDIEKQGLETMPSRQA